MVRFPVWCVGKVFLHVPYDFSGLFVVFILHGWRGWCCVLVFLEVCVKVEGECVEASVVAWFFLVDLGVVGWRVGSWRRC